MSSADDWLSLARKGFVSTMSRLMLSPSIKIIEHMCSEFWCLLFCDWFWVKVV